MIRLVRNLYPSVVLNCQYTKNTQSEDINCMKIIKITEDHYGPLGTKKDALFKGLELEGNGAKLVKK